MSNNPNQQEPNTKLPTVYDIKREEIQRYLEETEEERAYFDSYRDVSDAS